jgi:competence protein ComEC
LRQTSGASRPAPTPESQLQRERRLWPRAARVEPLRFNRAPLLAAALCFALGETIAELQPGATRSPILLLAAAIVFAALALVALARTLRLALLPIAALWIATGLWSAQLQPTPSPQTELIAYADGLSRTVQARVVRIRTLPARSTSLIAEGDVDPDQWEQPGTPTTSIDLSLTAIEDITPNTARMVPIAEGIRATIFTPQKSVISTEALERAGGESNGAQRRNLQLPGKPAQSQPQLHCGDLITAPMRLRTPERYRDPGAWQYADYLLDQGIAATANIPDAKLQVVPAAPSPLSATLQCRVFAAQTWAAARLIAYTHSTPNRRLPALLRLSPDDAGMLNAMLFGDRSRLTRALRLGFERTGSFHLFVVSGMHVALLAGGIFWLTRRLRVREVLATAITLTLTAAYALLTGFGVPVQRALLMTAVFLVARLLSRQRNPLNALGAAALAVLIWSPRALFEASFQMTFLAIVAIAGIAIPLGEHSFLPYAHAARDLTYHWKDSALPPRLAQFRLMLRLWGHAFAEAFSPKARALPAALVRTALWAGELALVGLIAEAVMVLPMALYFHRATVFALPANMVSIPLVAILAPLGIATFWASLLSAYLAAIPGAATALLLHAITHAISFASRNPSADLRVPGPTLVPALFAAACFALCCWAVRRSRAASLLALASLPIAAAIVLWPEPPAVHPAQLEVTAIDVGQGDSLLVVGPTGRTMLIDAGGPTGAAANAENAASNSSAFDVGEEVVSPYLWSRQLRHLDIVALTHAHSDHMGGMPAILRNFHPAELWVAVDPNSAPYRALLAETAALHIPVRHLRAGDAVIWDSIDINVLAPAPAYINAGPPINNDSLVMRLRFGQSSALLEGDAEAPSERSMIARSSITANAGSAAIGPDTLLKVGHHGSRTSTTPDFLALAAPQYAIISVGRQNTFGHPRPEVLGRLSAAHARLYRTDEFGLTTFLLNRDGHIAALTPALGP